MIVALITLGCLLFCGVMLYILLNVLLPASGYNPVFMLLAALFAWIGFHCLRVFRP
jgi:hypothetical protein